MPDDFLIFLLYLFYGMAFFAIGVSITSRDTQVSNLQIASVLWLLALFAYSHAFHEWFELYQQLPSPDFAAHFLPLVNLFKLGLVFISFVFLFLFGIRLLCISHPTKRVWFYLVPLAMAVLLVISLWPVSIELTPDNFVLINQRMRNFIGLPAAVCSGIGLILYSRTVENISRRGAKNFIGAGLAFLVYGVLAGLVPSGSSLPVVSFPVELARGVTAFVILHFVMNALHTFDEERKLLTEERLTRFAKSEKLHALGKLAFGIAHEINNPLTNVSMNVEMLKNACSARPDAENIRKRFDSIERNLDRASKIARELLAFSAEKETEFVPTSLNDVLDSTLELLGARLRFAPVTIAKGDIPLIAGIPWKIEEVFLNLLINAMDATEERGDIEISTYQKDKAVFVQIRDSGKGIPEQILNRVMDPFFTTKDPGHGTGLGLSICYGIMDLHKGTIEMVSREGHGTIVTLSFPAKDSSQ